MSFAHLYRPDDRVYFNGEWHVVVAVEVSRSGTGVALKLVREVAMARPLRTGAPFTLNAGIVDSDKVRPSEAVKRRAALARAVSVHEPTWTMR